jgi:hypothetical protein
MSLELSGCKSLVVAKSGIPGTNGINIYGSDGDIDIPMEDFCALIEYALTNTDLFPDDPRLKLIEKIKQADIAEGYNPGNTRIVL